MFDDPRVSWQHAVLRLDQGEWVLADTGSKNGIYTGPRRVSLLRITGDCVVRLADSQDGPEVSCRLSRPDHPDGAGAGSQLRVDLHPTSVRQIAGSLVRIGRAPENDVVVADLGVSALPR